MNIKEIAERNIFVKNAKAIRNICTAHNVDIGVAALMWAERNNIVISEAIAQFDEYRGLCGEHTLNVIADAVAEE